MLELGRLIAGSEDWLMQRVLDYAKAHGYTRYTSTLVEAWRASIAGLSDPLIAFLRDGNADCELAADADFAADPSARFGVIQAGRHRERGVTLGLFLGLFKYYRQAYIDLVEAQDLAPAERARQRYCLERFFDRVELGFCSEWARGTDADRLAELQTRNRLLANEKNRYLTIFESLDDPVLFMDGTGRVANMNNAALRTFSGPAVPGAMYYGSTSCEALEHNLAALTGATTGALDLDCTLDTVAGPRLFHLKSHPMLDVSEKFPGRVLILRDITKARATEEALKRSKDAAEAANRAKSAFLANMSHELRTPLNAILGFCQLLQRDAALTSSQSENLAVITRSGEHLLNLINDVLDMSKIEAGRMTLDPAPADLYRLLADVAEMMTGRAEAKTLAFTLDLAPDLPRAVMVDAGKLRQILINLCANGIKYTDEGGVCLRAAASPDGRTLAFEVEDSGRGIAATDLPRIFDPFIQIGRRPDAAEGTGLGLPISREYARLMGGDIRADSQPGHGSVFHVTVQVEPADETAVQTSAARPRVLRLAPDQPAWRVLVVDDAEANRILLKKLLRQVGFDVRDACDGAEAVAIFTEWQPHFIWMDMRMPVMDGYQAVRCIRGLPGGGETAIAALTASAFAEHRVEVLAAGCDEFVRKPFRESELFEVMGRLLGVRFVYEGETPAPPEPLTATALARLPGPLLAELRQAVLEGDGTKIAAAIARITVQDAALARALDGYAHDFLYEQMAETIDQAVAAPVAS